MSDHLQPENDRHQYHQQKGSNDLIGQKRPFRFRVKEFVVTTEEAKKIKNGKLPVDEMEPSQSGCQQQDTINRKAL